MRLLILLIFFCFFHAAYAEPVVLSGSTSPDGKYFLAIEPSPDLYSSISDKLQVRRTTDEKILGSFNWGQFGPHVGPDSARVLWKRDSKAFALTTYTNRGWTQSAIYVNDGAKWAELSIPDVTTKYSAKNGWDTRGKGHFIAVAWLPKNRIKMELYDELIWKNTDASRPSEIEAERIVIIYQLLRDEHGPFLDAWSVDDQSETTANP